jgi:Sec-independent protein translocase protein TatA
MFKLIIYLFLGWLLYKLVFDFIIPVYKTTKQVRRQMSDMQQHMRDQYQQQQQAQQQSAQRPTPTQKVSDKGDYIDFEEVK